MGWGMRTSLLSSLAFVLITWSVGAMADLSPVRVVENAADVHECSFVGQVTQSNGPFSIKTANRLLESALQEAANAGADTAIVRKSGHGGVLLDAFKCKKPPVPNKP